MGEEENVIQAFVKELRPDESGDGAQPYSSNVVQFPQPPQQQETPLKQEQSRLRRVTRAVPPLNPQPPPGIRDGTRRPNPLCHQRPICFDAQIAAATTIDRQWVASSAPMDRQYGADALPPPRSLHRRTEDLSSCFGRDVISVSSMSCEAATRREHLAEQPAPSLPKVLAELGNG